MKKVRVLVGRSVCLSVCQNLATRSVKPEVLEYPPAQSDRRARRVEASTTIGAFRDDGARVDLPEALAALRTADVDPKDFRLGPGHHLNHGAFGAAFGVCSDLAAKLRLLAEVSERTGGRG